MSSKTSNSLVVISDVFSSGKANLPNHKAEHVDEYKAIHANAWPGVLVALARHHITDYSIHYYPPLNLLVANMKYTGDDFEKDMKGIAADPETQRWWAVTDGMQESFQEGATGSGKTIPWWTDLEEVFRFEGEA